VYRGSDLRERQIAPYLTPFWSLDNGVHPIESVDDKLRDIRPGEFLVRSKSGVTSIVEERWLMSYHKTLSIGELAKINSPVITNWFGMQRGDAAAHEKPADVPETDYYDILEVSPRASIEVIEKAYRVLAKRYHPDTASGNIPRAESEEKMKILNRAYEILSSPRLRANYDEQRHRASSRH
jgi:hypothetical protein